MKAYKGFDQNLCCLGFQYEVGKEYKTDRAEVCESGFHACPNPLSVFDYYSPDNSRYCEVEQSGIIEESGDKKASTKIKVVAEIGIAGLVKAHIEWIKESTIDKIKGLLDKVIGSSGNYAQIGSSGNYAQIGSSGNYAQIGSSGNDAKIGSSGNYAQIGSSGNDAQIGSSGNGAQIGSSGNYAKIGSSGNYAQIGSSGNDAKIGSSGDGAKIGSSGNYAQIGSSGNDAKIGSSGNYAQIGSSGNYAQIGSSGNDAKIGSSGDVAKIGSSGNYAQIDCKGKDAVVACAGRNATVRAPVGAWVCLPEYKLVGGMYKCVDMKAFRIDGKKYPADKWLMLKNGKVVVVIIKE